MTVKRPLLIMKKMIKSKMEKKMEMGVGVTQEVEGVAVAQVMVPQVAVGVVVIPVMVPRVAA